jgi:hypothetical protein
VPTNTVLKRIAFRNSDLLIWAGMLYLAIPLMLFFAYWTVVPFALLSTSLLIFVFAITFPRFNIRSASNGLIRNELIVSILTAGLWTFSSGVWPGPFGRAGDWWDTRDDILSTLTQRAWPVTHVFQGEIDPATMRHYLSFYLPGSGVGKIFGSNVSLTLFATGFWMMLGIALIFFMVLRYMSYLGTRKYLVIPVFVFFSGLDIVGGRIKGTVGLSPGRIINGGHIEWWLPEFQYSSFTTAFQWVPQHAISGWLGTMIVLRIFETKKHYAFLPLLVSAVFLWSTFTALGISIVIAMQAFQHLNFREGLRVIRRLVPSAVICFIAVVLLASYLLANTTNIPKFPIFSHEAYRLFGFSGPLRVFQDYLSFLTFEFGMYIVLLFLLLKNLRKEIALLAIVLCLIPLYRVGLFNDFAMRVSIPPLLILMLLVARGLLQKSVHATSSLFRIALLAVLVLGSVTPLYEFFSRYKADFKTLETPCIDSGCGSQVAGNEIRDFYWSDEMPFFIKTGK